LIRQYKLGDELKILKLHNEVFDTNRTLGHWGWQFRNHIQGHGWITLAEVRNEIVGHYCLFQNHLNFMGQESIVGQGCDRIILFDQLGEKLLARTKHF
jgi:hypothetical protein